MAGGSTSSRPRYAPDDPTLPKPWRALVDGSTGYLYYWNPETNVTQYERPSDELPPPPPLLPPPPPLLPPKSASVIAVSRHHPDDRRHRHDDDDRHDRSRIHQDGNGRSRNGHSTKEKREGKISTGGQGSSVNVGRASSIPVEAYRRQNEIIVTGEDVPAPFMTFESAGFPPEILEEVCRAGFSAPTPIQAQSWPIALQSHDIVAIAKTGSGKTLGYLFPGFMHLKRLRNDCKLGPTMLILAPTRELATQIQDEALKFGRSSRILSTCVYGGAPKGPQLRDLDRGVDIIVATPGRLNDILEMKRVSLRQVSYLVLDEADRMLDMGFEPQIRKIVKEVPHRRQTLMFTATWPKEVRKIAADLLVHPVQVNIGSSDELVANTSITQYVEVITPVEKQRRVEQILRNQDAGSKVLIFCTTKRMCDQLSRTLARQFKAAAIHGDKSQAERDRVLSQFRTGRSPILVATDVAARGLDIKDIRVVINYDFPTGVEDYVHRIGRTGRAGATGVSYTFFCQQDSKYASDLVKILEGANQKVPKELKDMVSRGGHGGRSRRWASRSDAKDNGRLVTGQSNLGGLLSLPSRSDSYLGSHGTNDREPLDRSRGRVRSRSRSHSRDRKNNPSLKRARLASPPSRNRGSRSRSHSPKHVLDRYRGGTKELTRVSSQLPRRIPSPTTRHASPPSRNQGRSRSRSRSHSPNRGYDRHSGRTREVVHVSSLPKRMPSPTAKHVNPSSRNHDRSPSKSGSPNPNRGYDHYGGGTNEVARSSSPLPKKMSSPTARHASLPSKSPHSIDHVFDCHDEENREATHGSSALPNLIPSSTTRHASPPGRNCGHSQSRSLSCSSDHGFDRYSERTRDAAHGSSPLSNQMPSPTVMHASPPGRSFGCSPSRSRSHSPNHVYSPNDGYDAHGEGSKEVTLVSSSFPKRMPSPAAGRENPHRNHVCSRSRSPSRSPNHGSDCFHGSAGQIASASPPLSRRGLSPIDCHASPPISNRGQSRSRSLSHSPGRGVVHYGQGSEQEPQVDLPHPITVPALASHRTSDPNHSVMPYDNQRSQSSDGGNIAAVELNESHGQDERSRKPHGSDSPCQWHKRSPLKNEDFNPQLSVPRPAQLPVLPLNSHVEEEEGMIPADEDSLIFQEDGRTSP
ncbi:DEAD-box ATP-dependent RNA helicase 14-like isoform X1 [Zingiber officinale]|uniref:DEAD-box ATP-dependent RNA helicase 14-like isoform X1 n=2 Tax=Zingiber officinale TaxID=94328 RepID=UPI001C4D3829|nr:DEAD-box ATP-dependent RNA helicase 14-like isoform X1 [Zingiber officinale]